MLLHRSRYYVPPKSFLNLPLEIRRLIYRELLVLPSPVVLGHFPASLAIRCYIYLGGPWADIKPCGAIIRVCKQVHEEALDVFFSENVFEARFGYELDIGNIFANIASQHQQCIRRLQIVVQPAGRWYLDPIDLQASTWASGLGYLSLLRIIAVQPPPKVEGETPKAVHDWLDRLRSLLAFLQQYCGPNTMYEVDDNGAKETSALVRATLPGCRKITCVYGDRFFLREDWQRQGSWRLS